MSRPARALAAPPSRPGGGGRGRVLLDARYLGRRYPGIGRYVAGLGRAVAAVAPGELVAVAPGAAARGSDRRGDGAGRDRLDPAHLAAAGAELVAARRDPSTFAGRRELVRLARRLGPDLLHAPHLPSALRLPCPTLLTVHDVIPLSRPDTVASPLVRILYRLVLRRALAVADRVVVPSRWVAGELAARTRLPSGRVAVVPEAAAEWFLRPPDEGTPRTARQRAGGEGRYLLHVGTARPHKNVEGLVAAWGLLPSPLRRGRRLLLAGAEDRRFPGARRAVAMLDPEAAAGVRFAGEVDDAELAGLYAGAELVVQPSLAEGFGLPALEAMACGAPVACSATTGLGESTAGAALHFDPERPAAIAEAIERVLTEPGLAAELAGRGRRRAREWRWEDAAARTAELYAELGG